MTAEPTTLTEHLEELRKRLIYSVAGILLAFAFCFLGFSETILDIVRAPIVPFLPEKGLVFTAPMDKFMAHVKVSLLSSVILTCPFWLYQLFAFISPGLYEKERKFSIWFILFGTILFVSGASFVYFVVFPMAFDFLMNFGGGTDMPMITISEYLGFFSLTTIVFGLMFELPLILSLLGIMGVIDQAFLKRYRRYAIVIMAVSAAMVTPPDAFSMLCMMGPLILLYELSVILVGFFERNREIPEG
ncbi:MAG: twin-arginine translocase subunit TatC [Bdellovibrionales bacterium]